MTAVAALEFEALKFRRAPTVRVMTVLLCLVLPLLAVALVLAARSGADTPLAAKASAMVVGPGWTGYLGVVGMMSSVGALFGVGFVVCWCFGREFSDNTFGSLFALPVSRRRTANAKFTVILAWSVLACLGTVGVALLAGLGVGLGPPDAAALAIAAQTLAVGLLTALLALPLAFVASLGRGYLPGVGGLVLLVVTTQIVTAFGAGAWFPWAAPGLWIGLGGPAASSGVGAAQLLLAVPVAALGIAATGQWWHAARLR